MHEIEADFNEIITGRGCAAMESDEEIRRVPEVGLELLTSPSTSGREATAAAAAAGTSSASQAASASRRGRSPADKEHRRLKRCVHASSNTSLGDPLRA
jgi:hypothetical protein